MKVKVVLAEVLKGVTDAQIGFILIILDTKQYIDLDTKQYR